MMISAALLARREAFNIVPQAVGGAAAPPRTGTRNARVVRWTTALRQNIEGACEAGTNAEGAKIAAVACENAVNLPALRYGGYRPVHQSEFESLKSGIQLQCSGDVGRKWQLVFVACGGVEDLADEFAYRLALRPQEIVHLGEDESGYDDGSGRSQDSFVFRKARLAGWRAGKRAQ